MFPTEMITQTLVVEHTSIISKTVTVTTVRETNIALNYDKHDCVIKRQPTHRRGYNMDCGVLEKLLHNQEIQMQESNGNGPDLKRKRI